MIAKIDEYYLEKGPELLKECFHDNIPFWLMHFYKTPYETRITDDSLPESLDDWQGDRKSDRLWELAREWRLAAELEWFLHKDVNKFQCYLRRAMKLLTWGYQIFSKNKVGFSQFDYMACGDLEAFRNFYFPMRGRLDDPLTNYEKMLQDPSISISVCEYRDPELLKKMGGHPEVDVIIGLVEYDAELWKKGMKEILKKHRTQEGQKGDILNLRSISHAILARVRGMDLKFKHRLLPAELQIPYSVPAELEASYPTSVSLFTEAWEKYILGETRGRSFIDGSIYATPENIAENEHWASALYDEIQRGTFVLNE